jgi:hypothetical protein
VRQQQQALQQQYALSTDPVPKLRDGRIVYVLIVIVLLGLVAAGAYYIGTA